MQASASHLMGGEITWECLSGGQYMFTLKLYRDCNGIPGPGNALLRVHNHPSVSSIPLTLISQTDISPQCSGAGPNITCAGGGPGAVEEFIYQSTSVTLQGVPPPQGWIFTFDHCCRNGAITNLQNPNTHGFTLRAVMYPYNGQSEDPCFDSSPVFAERPATIVCTGSPFTYNHNAYDRDLDSLSYSWADPLNDFVGAFIYPSNPQPIPFSNGYSVSSPLPSTIQDPNNIPAAIDQHTGEISFTSYTAGNFVSTVKVEAWKCGQKVAEIFREIQIVLIPCAPNVPPEVTPPFPDPVTNLYTSFADTVFAGDTVTFTLTVADTGLLPSGNPQTVIIDATGSQFGAGFTSTGSGCLNPPCATLSPAPSFSGLGGLSTIFNWVTSCDHFSYNNPCFTNANTYSFVFRVQDNFCPVPSYRLVTVSITIRAKPLLAAPSIHCLAVDSNGGVAITWEAPPDSTGSFNSYHLFTSPNPVGPYTLLDSIFSYSQNTYYHASANANAAPVYYYMMTRAGCGGKFYSLSSDTLSTIHLTHALPGNGTVSLSWNALSNPNPATASGTYLLYREHPQGTWMLIDSTSNTSYTDTIRYCNDTLRYRIEMYDTLGCYSISSLDTVITSNAGFLLNAGNDSSICFGDSLMLGGAPTAPAGSAVLWMPAPGLSNISSYNPYALPPATQSYVVNAALNNCAAADTVTIAVLPLPAANAGADPVICAGDSVQLNASGGMGYQWFPSAGLNNASIAAPLASPLSTATYIVTVSGMNGCSANDSVQVTVNALPLASAGSDAMLCEGDSILLQASGGSSYAWSPVQGLSNASNASTFAFPGDTTAYIVTVTDTNNCSSSDTVIVNVASVPIASAGNDITICTGDSIMLSASGGVTYQWTPPAGLSSDTIANPLASPQSSTTYTVLVSNSSGCTAADDITVLTTEKPDASFSISYTISCEGAVARFENTSSGSVDYIWYLGEGTFTAATDPVHTYPFSGTYYITLIASNGQCRDTAMLSQPVNDVASYAGLTVPNVFSPNGDGTNDRFSPELNSELSSCAAMKIYNRWGNLISASGGAELWWDGRTEDGKAVPAGTYFYIISLNEYEVRGIVTVLYD
jgi:gliding motility-associated-like protein